MTPCQQDQSAVVVRRSLTRVAHFGAALPDDLAERLWTEPTALVDRGQVLQAKGARRTVLLDWGSHRYVLKHYVEPTRRHTVKQLVLSSRAWRTWSVSHTLADAGVATPRPIACVENRWSFLRRDSFLMYPYVEGRTLRSCLDDAQTGYRALPDYLLRQLAELWQGLARVKASLADPNRGNFIVSATGKVWVIDLDKACLHRLASVAAHRQRRNWRKVSRCRADEKQQAA